MKIIKRYPNRKLYDLHEKKYVNLETLAELIRQGMDIQVLDHVTGEDLTALTLTQIIMEREKKDGNFLPHSLLATLIKTGGESLSTIRQRLAAPSELIQLVDKEIEKRLHGLIQRGQIAEETGKELYDHLINHRQPWSNWSRVNLEELETALRKQAIPSRRDFQVLIDQINELSSKIDEFAQRE
ncbi:MAG: hypothetical protein MUO62_04940 [Anaerolineales bacterium]|nr:hypothetical protein [Anaerolineales bacterium]